MDSPSTPTAEESPRRYSLDDLSITSSTTDEFSGDAYSFMSNASFASSQSSSIVSYKTDKTVNSRKSRYNALPRRKYADIVHLTLPQGFVSSDVDGTSVLEVCKPPGVAVATTTLALLFRPR